MHMRQPMHRSWSMSVTPSGVVHVAPTGQTFTHGGFWQCMHGVGMNRVPSIGGETEESSGFISPTSLLSSCSYTSIHCIGSGTKWPELQASVHRGGVPCDWQPSHRRRSIIIIHWRSRLDAGADELPGDSSEECCETGSSRRAFGSQATAIPAAAAPPAICSIFRRLSSHFLWFESRSRSISESGTNVRSPQVETHRQPCMGAHAGGVIGGAIKKNDEISRLHHLSECGSHRKLHHRLTCCLLREPRH